MEYSLLIILYNDMLHALGYDHHSVITLFENRVVDGSLVDYPDTILLRVADVM